MKKVVTHKPPRHTDDFLAIALLLDKYPEAQVVMIHPQEVPQEFKDDPEVAVVDVGGSYNPEKLNFDHHQDKNLPSSVILVMKHFGLDTDKEFLRTIDHIDRFGFPSALKEGLVKKDEKVEEMLKTILLTELNANTAKIVAETVQEASKDTTYEDFIKTLYENLKETPEFKKALESIEREKREFEEKLNNLIIREVEGIRIAYSTKTLAPFHRKVFEMNIDLLIEQNSQSPSHTSLIVNTSSQKVQKATELREQMIKDKQIIFRHQTGFIVVVNEPVENFLP